MLFFLVALGWLEKICFSVLELELKMKCNFCLHCKSGSPVNYSFWTVTLYFQGQSNFWVGSPPFAVLCYQELTFSFSQWGSASKHEQSHHKEILSWAVLVRPKDQYSDSGIETETNVRLIKAHQSPRKQHTNPEIPMAAVSDRGKYIYVEGRHVSPYSSIHIYCSCI